MRLSRLALAAAVALPLAITATQASAIPVTFSSNGSFSGVSNCSATSPACTVTSNGNTLVLGTSTTPFFGFPTTPYSTLTAVDQASTPTATPKNDFKIGEIDWTNAATSNTDQAFSAVYNLTLNFTAPSNKTVSQAITFTISQPTNPPGDTITSLLIGTNSPLDTVFSGLSVSDVKFSLMSGSGGSTYNAATGEWRNPEGNIARLQITADFNEVPEPASMAVFGAGLIGLRLLQGRRKANRPT